MNLLKVGAGALLLLASSVSHAIVFTCEGVITDVFAIGNNTYEVNYEKYHGNQREPVFIYPEHTNLLGPALTAKMEGQQDVVYILVLEDRTGTDTRCVDGNTDNALIGLYKKYNN